MGLQMMETDVIISTAIIIEKTGGCGHSSRLPTESLSHAVESQRRYYLGDYGQSSGFDCEAGMEYVFRLTHLP